MTAVSMLTAWPRHMELLSGELSLVVEHIDGSSTTFAVSLEFDGNLSD
jgi:hypothetical protein